MILLQQDTTNQVTVSLTEKQEGTGSVYLLQISNDTSKEVFSGLVEDESEDPFSYNTFFISVSSTGSADSGSFVLPLPGFYHYSFYESGSDNLLEIGKIQLLPAISSLVTAFTSSYAPASVFNPAQYGL